MFLYSYVIPGINWDFKWHVFEGHNFAELSVFQRPNKHLKYNLFALFWPASIKYKLFGGDGDLIALHWL